MEDLQQDKMLLMSSLSGGEKKSVGRKQWSAACSKTTPVFTELITINLSRLWLWLETSLLAAPGFAVSGLRMTLFLCHSTTLCEEKKTKIQVLFSLHQDKLHVAVRWKNHEGQDWIFAGHPQSCEQCEVKSSAHFSFHKRTKRRRNSDVLCNSDTLSLNNVGCNNKSLWGCVLTEIQHHNESDNCGFVSFVSNDLLVTIYLCYTTE